MKIKKGKRENHIFAFILLTIMTLSAVCTGITSSAAEPDGAQTEETPADMFKYYIDRDINAGTSAVTITGYQGEDSDVVIPSVIENSPVTCIGMSAFASCSHLKSVSIPDSVTEIDPYAFNGCGGLSSITIPDSVAKIYENAFSSCGSLTEIAVSSSNPNYSSQDGALFNKDKTKLLCCPAGKSGTYITPDTVSEIGIGAFSGCRNLNNITLSNSVTLIRDSAFIECAGLSTITLPDSVKTIETRAFEGCSGLSTITIPANVEFIGDRFYGCTNLANIIVNSDNKQYSSQNGILFDKPKTRLIRCPIGKKGTYVAPNSVTAIGDGAFYGCSGLSSITLPNQVTYIDGWAFENCTGLSNMTLPDSVDSILHNAFKGCSGLHTVILSDSLTRIGYSVFDGCNNLSSLFIPSGVTSIGFDTFNNCSSLTDIYYGGSENDWENIQKENLGDPELMIPASITIHYNSTRPSQTVITPPKAVTNVKAASAGYNSIKITWKRNSAAAGYEIYRSKNKNSTYKRIRTVTSNKTTSCTDKNLTTGTTYYYKIKAYKTSEKIKKYSAYSKIASAKPALSKPVVTSVKTAGSKKLAVKWKKVTGANGYEIYRSTKKNGKYQKVKTITKGTTISFKDVKLTKGKIYYYKIKSYRKVNKKKVYSTFSTVKSCRVSKK